MPDHPEEPGGGQHIELGEGLGDGQAGKGRQYQGQHSDGGRITVPAVVVAFVMVYHAHKDEREQKEGGSPGHYSSVRTKLHGKLPIINDNAFLIVALGPIAVNAKYGVPKRVRGPNLSVRAPRWG